MDKHIVDDLSELKTKIDNLHKRLSLLIEPKNGIAEITGTQILYLLIQNDLGTCEDLIYKLWEWGYYLKDKTEKEIENYFINQKTF